MPVLIPAVAALISVIPAALGAGTVASLAIGTGIASVLVYGGISFGLSTLSGLLTSQNKPRSSVANNGHLINTRETTEPLKIVYGRYKVGGNWVFCKPTGTSNKNLNVIVTWSEGECSGYDQAIDTTVNFSGKDGLNDLKVNGAGTYTGANTVYRVKIDGVGSPNTFEWSDNNGTSWNATGVSCSTSWTNLNNGVQIKFGATAGHTNNTYWTFGAGDGIWVGESLIHYFQEFGEGKVNLINHHNFHTGSTTQSYDTDLYADVPEHTDCYKSTCYSFFQLKFSQIAYKNIPDFFVLLKGRTLYDPRDLSTAWSRNPALVWRDFMTNTRYGLGIPASMIDDTSVGTAATWCEANGYYFDGCVQDRKAFLDNIDDILANFKAFVVYSEGAYALKIHTDDAAVMALTESDVEITPESFSLLIPGIPETPNKATVIFADQIIGYTNQFASYEDNSAITTDGDPREIEIPLIGTSTYTQARKLAKFILLRARTNKEFTILCHSRCYALEPGDIVTITHTFPGWTAYKVRVKAIGVPMDGLVPITFLDESTTIYDDTIDETTPDYPQPPQPPVYPDSPTNLAWTTGADTETVTEYDAYIDFSWDYMGEGVQYTLQFKEAGDSWPETGKGTKGNVTVTDPGGAVTTVYQRVGKLECNLLYNWRVRSILPTMETSDWVEGTNATTYAPGTGPDISGITLTATGRAAKVFLKWNHPATAIHKTLDRYVICRNITGIPPADANYTAETGDYLVHKGRWSRTHNDDDDIVGTTKYYYYLKAIDRWNQLSTSTATANCIPSSTISDDTTPPSMPTDLANTTPVRYTRNPDHYKTTLSWTASTDDSGRAVRYEVRIWLSGDSADDAEPYTTRRTQIKLRKLLSNQIYYWNVTAIDWAGNYVATSAANFTTGTKNNPVTLYDLTFLAHFDGPEPSRNNFTGNPVDILGASPINRSGGIIFRPGRFGKGVQTAQGATNLIKNPSFETDVSTNWTFLQGGTGGTVTQSSTTAWVGSYSAKLTCGTDWTEIYSDVILVPNGSSITVQSHAWRTAALTTSLMIWDATNGVVRSTSSATLNEQWEHLYCTWTNTTGLDANINVILQVDDLHGMDAYFDGVQAELTPYGTPFLDGTMGDGHVTNVDTTSSRTASLLQYTNEIYTKEQGTILFYYTHTGAYYASAAHTLIDVRDGTYVTGPTIYIWDASTIVMWLNSANRIVGTYTITPNVPFLITYTYNFISPSHKLYVNGIQVGSTYTGSMTMPEPGASITVGSLFNGTYQADGVIDELAFVNRILTEDEILTIYESGSPLTAVGSIHKDILAPEPDPPTWPAGVSWYTGPTLYKVGQHHRYKLQVTWDPCTDLGHPGSERYQLQYDVATGLANATTVECGASSNHQFKDLESGTTYYFRVRCRDKDMNWTGWSAEKSLAIVADTTAPAAPTTDTSYPKRKASSYDLRWTKNTEADLAGYNIYVNTSNSTPTKGDTNYIIKKVSGSTTHTLVRKGLTTIGGGITISMATTYYFWLSAFDRDNNESTLSAFSGTGAKIYTSEWFSAFTCPWDVSSAISYRYYTTTNGTTYTVPSGKVWLLQGYVLTGTAGGWATIMFGAQDFETQSGAGTTKRDAQFTNGVYLKATDTIVADLLGASSSLEFIILEFDADSELTLQRRYIGPAGGAYVYTIPDGKKAMITYMVSNHDNTILQLTLDGGSTLTPICEPASTGGYWNVGSGCFQVKGSGYNVILSTDHEYVHAITIEVAD